MADALWVVGAVILGVGFLTVLEVVNRGTLGHFSVLEWLLHRVADPRFGLHAGALEAYGHPLGLLPGTVGSGFCELPTAQGTLRGVFVVVTYSIRPRSTIVTSVAHGVTGDAVIERSAEPPGVSDSFAHNYVVRSHSGPTGWLTASLQGKLLALSTPAVCFSLSGSRFVLTLGGLHLTNVALLDQALDIVVTAALHGGAEARSAIGAQA